MSVVDGEPYLDLYKLARFLVGAEPLSIALYGVFQLGCHLEHILLTIRLIIKSRMPVILRPEDEEPWLDASRTSFAKAKSALKPYPEKLMDAHDVSPIVNSAKYDGPERIQPVSDDEIPRRGQLSLFASNTKII
jgi:SOS response associated peptidase (SRAP)